MPFLGSYGQKTKTLNQMVAFCWCFYLSGRQTALDFHCITWLSCKTGEKSEWRLRVGGADLWINLHPRVSSWIVWERYKLFPTQYGMSYWILWFFIFIFWTASALWNPLEKCVSYFLLYFFFKKKKITENLATCQFTAHLKVPTCWLERYWGIITDNSELEFITMVYS